MELKDRIKTIKTVLIVIKLYRQCWNYPNAILILFEHCMESSSLCEFWPFASMWDSRGGIGRWFRFFYFGFLVKLNIADWSRECVGTPPAPTRSVKANAPEKFSSSKSFVVDKLSLLEDTASDGLMSLSNNSPGVGTSTTVLLGVVKVFVVVHTVHLDG